MPPLTTADIAFLLCTSQQHPNQTPRRDRPVTLETDYGLLIRLLPDGSVSAGLATPPIPQAHHQPPQRRPAPARAPTPPPPSSIAEILHTPLTPGPSPGRLGLFDEPPPSAFFSQPQQQPKPQPKPSQRQHQPGPPPPPPPPAQQFKYLLAPSLVDPSASYLWYVGGWPGNPPPPESPHDAPTPPLPSPPQRDLPPAPARPHAYIPIPRPSQPREAPPHPVPEDTLSTRYHPSWFNGYLDWAERLEGAGSFAQMDEGERVLWTVEGLLLACWLSLQGDVAGVEYRPEGAEGSGRVFEVRGGDLSGVLGGLFRHAP